MKVTKYPKLIALFYLAVVCGGPVSAQDAATAKKPEKMDEAALMAAMADLAKPNENHKILEGMVGSWNYKIKAWMSPDPSAPPQEFTGLTTIKSTMGGRYFISEHNGKMQIPGPDGKMQDMDFKGMSVDGYDNVKKKFVSTWIDNFGTGIVITEGTYDAPAKKLTYTGEYEPMPGEKVKVRQICVITDSDHHSLEEFEDRGGKEVKTMEVVYTRATKTP